VDENRINLSVCMIIRDESERLPRVIESVRPIADEVIVVDTGSTDDSIAVAEGLGAAVIRHVWQDDFAEARNTSIEAAHGDWILCIDADEFVPAESLDKIREAMSADGDAYFVRIESAARSSAGKCFVNFFPRLFRKMDGVRFEGRVHEQIFPSLERAKARVLVSEIVLGHTGYDLSAKQLAEKARRNADLLLRESDNRPDDPLVLYHLGEAYSMMDDYGGAIEFYEKALGVGRLPKEILCALYQNLGSALVKQRRYEEAIIRLRKALKVDPSLLTAHLVIASALFGMGKFDRAEAEILSYISRTQDANRGRRLRLGYEPEIGSALVLLAKCRLARGDLEKAREALTDAIGLDGGLGDAHILLGKIAFEELRFGQAVTHYEAARKTAPPDERLYFELARSYVACGSTDKAAELIEVAVREGLESAPLLRCLGILRIKKKDYAGAVEAYKESLCLEPDDSESRRRLAGLLHIMGDDESAREYITVE
jgi:tetratricopeptide (TPR) repeat protein